MSKEEKKPEITLIFSEEKGCRLIKLQGEVGHSELASFQEKVDQFLLMPEKHLLIDLSGVSYISSSGLRILLKLGKEAQQIEKNLVFFNLSDFVASVFKVSGFDKIFNIQTNKEAALKAAGV